MQHALPSDERGVYVGCLVVKGTGVRCPACILTGFPVLNKQKLDFPNSAGSAVAANRDDWNKFANLAKVLTAYCIYRIKNATPAADLYISFILLVLSMCVQSSRNADLQDVLKFISQYAGAPPASGGYSFQK